MGRCDPSRSVRMPSRRAFATVFAPGLLLSAGCGAVVDVETEVSPVVELRHADEQGILSPAWVRVTVTDTAGVPLSGTEVEWQVVSGGGTVGLWYLGPGRDPDMWPQTVSTTDEHGRATMWWLLGPVVGEQQLQVRVAGSDPVTARVLALPGVVFVGVWTGLAAERQAQLPSDTMRVHATNYIDSIDRSLEDFQKYPESAVIVGAVRRGPGLDDAWLFHLGPAWVRAGLLGAAGTCVSDPPLTEEELAATLAPGRDASSYNLCPGYLRVVAIESVPQSYIDRLAGR
jgi:hypothetical protein